MPRSMASPWCSSSRSSSRSGRARCALWFRRPERQAVARREPDAGGLPGGQLHHGLGAAATRDAPRRQVRDDAEDAVLLVEEDRVDREAHEPHVNGGSGAKENPLAPLEPGTPEEPSEAGERRLREETPLTHQAAVVTFQ